jgi:hypothetical protein
MSDGALWAEFLIRALATGFVVVFIAWSAARLGPAVGGVLVGLPIVLAPGFFFLVRDHSPAFVAEVAAGALFSLAATQGFLGAYVVGAAFTRSASLATLSAATCWAVLALPLAFMPHPPLAGAGLFVMATIIARLVGRRFVRPLPSAPSPARWSLLILRGVAAGLLVGMVTLAAAKLGPALAGMLVAFPIGFCVILLSLSMDHGPALAARTAYTGLIGVASLAAFCLVLATALKALSPSLAFVAALGASFALTAVMTLASRRMPRPSSLP